MNKKSIVNKKNIMAGGNLGGRFVTILPCKKVPKLTAGQLIAKGDIVKCVECGGLSAYSWLDVSDELDDGKGGYMRPTRAQRDLIAYVGAADCFGFKCGHCQSRNTERDATILAECYTHTDYASLEQEQRMGERSY